MPIQQDHNNLSKKAKHEEEGSPAKVLPTKGANALKEARSPNATMYQQQASQLTRSRDTRCATMLFYTMSKEAKDLYKEPTPSNNKVTSTLITSCMGSPGRNTRF